MARKRTALDIHHEAAISFGDGGSTVKPWLTREAALALVDAYGAAWMARDPLILSSLFTEDAVYSERPFASDKGVFEGRNEIQEYYRQIMRRQRGLQFRQSRSELVLDAGRSRCLAKWEARFEYHHSTGAWMPTRIMQVVILRLRNPLAEGGGGATSSSAGPRGINGNGHVVLPRIAGLEEYWHTENSHVPDGPKKGTIAAEKLAAKMRTNGGEGLGRGDIPCRDFVRGRCQYGRACFNSHTKGEAAVATALAMRPRAPGEDESPQAQVAALLAEPEGKNLDQVAVSAYLNIMSDTEEKAFRDGDWLCTSCQSHNFAKRNTCLKCQAPFHSGCAVWSGEAAALAKASALEDDEADPLSAPSSAAALAAPELKMDGPWLPDAAIQAAVAHWRKQEEEQASGQQSSGPDPEMQAALDMLAQAAAVVGIDAEAVLGASSSDPAQGAAAANPSFPPEPPAKVSRLAALHAFPKMPMDVGAPTGVVVMPPPSMGVPGMPPSMLPAATAPNPASALAPRNGAKGGRKGIKGKRSI